MGETPGSVLYLIIELTVFGRWLLSGDEVAVNERREMFFRDRIKEFLKVKAYQGALSNSSLSFV